VLVHCADVEEGYASHYIEPATAFSQPGFWDFNTLCAATHYAIPIAWITNHLDLNTSEVEYLIFNPKDHKIPATFRDPTTKDESLVTRDVFVAIIDNVKA
jgi:hypothetical protein